jgi:uncharacterized MAPEG superfamily protein
VTILIVIFTFYLSIGVGQMRGEVPAPATTGNIEFEKRFRAHYNTIEHMVMFLPMMWLSLAQWGDVITASIGGVWLIGRIIYAHHYIKDPLRRTPGLLIGLAALLAVTVGAVINVVTQLI